MKKTSLNIPKIFLMSLILLTMTKQFVNAQVMNLNGEWEILKDTLNEFTNNDVDEKIGWQSITVPSTWHIVNEGFLDYQGIAWYRKVLTITKIETGKRYILEFEAVDYLSKVYINNKFIGENEGGYTPFSFDITEALKEGDNKILVRVNDPTAEEQRTDGIRYWHIPHGKQSWYVQCSGIWQDVFLKIKPINFIKTVKINSDISGKFEAKIDFDFNDVSQKEYFELKIYSPEGKEVFQFNKEADSITEIISGEILKPQLWELKSPNLYTIKINYNGETYEDKYGFREFKKENGKFYLNGKPFYMISALDQDFYPETIYTTPSEEYLRDEIIKAKEMGLNTLRCHIKIPDKNYLKLADELGILVWYEIPNWDFFDESVKSRARSTFDRMLERDWNHPSLCVISIINESWGIDLNQKEQREWLINEFDYAKEKAAGRLIVDNSACWGNFHLKTDINDYHTYWAIPENKINFSNTIKDVANRPDWLFSNFGDSHQTGDEVIMISEFGNWGLPILPDALPFWFDRQFIDIDVSMPKGVYERFNKYKLNRIFKSYNELAGASQIAQYNALKWQIEEIRLAKDIQGYVITEFTDINWEVNGLLDMWRNYKYGSKKLNKIQQPDIIIPRTEKYNYWEKDTAVVEISISNFSGENLSNSLLKYKTSDGYENSIKLTSIKNADVQKAAEIKINVGETNIPRKLKIEFTLEKDSIVLSENFTEVYIFPGTYKIGKIAEGENNDVIISQSIDSLLLSKIRNGANAICIIDSNTVLTDEIPIEIKSRNSEWLDGNWASALSWVDNSKSPFKNINLGNTMGFEAYDVFPKYVLTGINAEYFDNVLSGMFIGWLHMNSAYLIEIKIGNGKLILTTFDFFKKTEDPYTKTLFTELIKYIKSEECKPTLTFLSKN